MPLYEPRFSCASNSPLGLTNHIERNCVERLSDVFDDVVNMLDAYGYPDKALGHS